MKKLVAFSALLISFLVVIPASAQLKFGVKAGVNVAQLSYDNKILETAANSVTGFTGGVMAELIVPIIGVGVDASLMYSRVGSDLPTVDELEQYSLVRQNMDYLSIPINLKWKAGIPFLGKVFLAAGPNFSFLINDDLMENIKTQQNVDLGVNLGGGIELLSKLQLSLQYTWGLTEHEYSVPIVESPYPDVIPGISVPIDGYKAQNRYWTITAAYLF